MATPPSVPAEFERDIEGARRIVQRTIAAGRVWLDPIEIAELMAAYSIPIASVALARDSDEAAAAAKPLLEKGAITVKILSPDIVH
jgi:acetyltransferase